MQAEPTDEALVLTYGRGDPSACEAPYRKHRGPGFGSAQTWPLPWRSTLQHLPTGLLLMAVSKLDIGAVLAALAEPRRAEIVRLLEQGYRSQRELSETLDMSQPLISPHLKGLRDAGLVGATVCERITVYILRPSTLRAMADRLRLMADNAVEIAKVQPC